MYIPIKFQSIRIRVCLRDIFLMNNSFNINVQATQNQDSKAVADEVMRRLKAQSRGALYDPVGALP